MKNFLRVAMAATLILSANLGYARPMAMPISVYCEEGLAEQLAKNANFESYSIGLVKLFNKIVNSKSQELFSKFIKKQTTSAETDLLMKRLGYENVDDFKQFSKNIISSSSTIATLYPELLKLENNDRKEVIKNAFKLVAQKESFKEMFRSTTYYICWAEWVACVAACSYMYSGDEFWECSLICEGFFSLCYITAD